MKKMIGLLFIGVLIIGGYFGFTYYNDTYNGKVAYAIVPNEIPTKEKTQDMDGRVIAGSSSYNYSFSFVTEDGQTAIMRYELSGSEPVPYTPGTFVTAKISKKRIVEGPNPLQESEIPEKVQKKLTNQ